MSIEQDLSAGSTSGSRTFVQKAIELGPYSTRLSLRITGRSHHESGGSGSRAQMSLYYDNAQVDSADDSNFDNAHLVTDYAVYMEAGSVAQFRIDTANHIATERSYSIQVDWRAEP